MADQNKTDMMTKVKNSVLNDKLKNNPTGSMANLIRYIPGMPNASIAVKCGLTAILVAICLFFMIPVSSQPDPMVKEILSYSPAAEAENIYEKNGPKAAFEFVNFYENLPGAIKSPQLDVIRQKANEERASLSYVTKEVGSALLGMEHHENYARLTQSAVGLVPYGRDLQLAGKYANEIIKEWKNYKSGQDIDTLRLGVATLGLVEVAISLLPGDNPTVSRLKAQTNVLLESLKVMNGKLRDVVSGILKPVLQTLEKSGLNQDSSGQELIDMIQTQSKKFMGILDQAETCLNQFQALVNLERKNKDFVPLVVASSSNLNELDTNYKLAQEIAKLNPNVLLYGGVPALQAAERLNAQGTFNIQTLEAAMAYGKYGLNAVGIMSWNQLEKEIEQARAGKTSKFRIPGVLIAIIILASLLIIARTWTPMPQKAESL